jgi:hypothetical protein
MSIKETDLAWAAGIVDGEGCIGLSRISNAHWSLRVAVGNTDIRMIDKLCQCFGGKARLQNKKPGKDGFKRKPLWTWVLYGEKAEAFLVAILPYLCNKADQAEIGIASRRYLHAKRYQRNYGAQAQTEKIAALTAMASEMARLKQEVPVVCNVSVH